MGSSGRALGTNLTERIGALKKIIYIAELTGDVSSEPSDFPEPLKHGRAI